MERGKKLSETVLFSGLEPEEVDELTELSSIKKIDEYEVVFSEGDEGDELFLIIGGRVQIVLHSADGKEIIVRTLGEGEMFGELSLLDGKKRSATVKTVQRCVFLVITRNNLFAFLERNSIVAIKLLTSLATRVRMLDALIEDTLAFKLPSKLAKVLLGMAKEYGQHTSTGININMDISKADLADIIGSTLQRVEDQLTVWEREGIVSLNRGSIIITDPNKLDDLLTRSLSDLGDCSEGKPV
jgi:CRP/FNR family cyclic AMP-dependent transcriptional regulator